MRTFTIGAAVLAAFSTAAAAADHTQDGMHAKDDMENLCFDKGSLSYVDCAAPPSVVVEFEEPATPEPEPEPMTRSKAGGNFYVGARAGVVWQGDIAYPDLWEGSRSGSQNMGFTGSAFAGYAFKEPNTGVTLRPELEIGYQSSSLSGFSPSLKGANGDARTLFGFANLYGDIAITPKLNLILGAGAGVAQVKVDAQGVRPRSVYRGEFTSTWDTNDRTFAYHLDAGLGFKVSENITLELLYRNTQIPNVQMTGFIGEERHRNCVSFEAKESLASHQGLIGLRIAL